MSVCLLEKTPYHEDNVRGEFLLPWGVAIAEDLGILTALERPGGNYTRWAIPYGEGLDPISARHLERISPWSCQVCVAPQNLEHRILCRALNEEAEAAGALLLRSVGRIEFEGGLYPRLFYSRNDKAFELEARVVVGADGRILRSPARLVLNTPGAILFFILLGCLLTKCLPGPRTNRRSPWMTV